MTRRPTFSELRWPMDHDSRVQAEHWARSISTQVLSWTWRAFDVFREVHLARVDLTQPLEQLERDLTARHFAEIQRLFSGETDGYSCIVPTHEHPEHETRFGGAAKPPAYDFAFVWYDNQRIAWPVEAKVLSTPLSFAEYLKDVQKFTSGIAGPFVGEGGLIAYLLSATASDFFHGLANELNHAIQIVSEFATRPHRSSTHLRLGAPDLRLHHMAMRCALDD